MPTYEYRCKGCGQHLEVVQAFTDDALTTCEACGGELRKVFGAVGISFKGSGFYKTDSRSSSGKGADTGTKAEAGADSGAAKEASGSGDSGKADTVKADSTKSGSDKSSSAATPA